MPLQTRDITLPPIPSWIQNLISGVSAYMPDIFSKDMAETPAAGLLPDYAKDWLQGQPVNPAEMMYESMTNQMGGGQPLAQIAERSGAKNLGAFLHRTIDPGEFGFLDWLWKKGKQSEAAASIITPTYRSIFHPSEPLPGVVFSVRNPENVRYWAPYDVWSSTSKVTPQPQKRIAERLDQRVVDLIKNKAPMSEIEKYNTAYKRVLSLPKTKELYPSRDYDLASDEPLNRILSRQQKRLENLAHEDPNMESTKFWELLNEVGYKMDPSEIVGVRVPRKEWQLPQSELLKKMSPENKAKFGDTIVGMNIGPPRDLPEEWVSAIDFAKRHNLPIWQFTPQTSPEEAAIGLADYLGIKSPLREKIAPDYLRELNDYNNWLRAQWEKGENLSGQLMEPEGWLAGPQKGRWYKRRTEEFPMGLVESTADPLAKYYGGDVP